MVGQFKSLENMFEIKYHIKLCTIVQQLIYLKDLQWVF